LAAAVVYDPDGDGRYFIKSEWRDRALDGRNRMRVQRTLLACLAVIGGASVAHAQEVTVKVGTVRSISTAAILWGGREGLFQRLRH